MVKQAQSDIDPLSSAEQPEDAFLLNDTAMRIYQRRSSLLPFADFSLETAALLDRSPIMSRPREILEAARSAMDGFIEGMLSRTDLVDCLRQQAALLDNFAADPGSIDVAASLSASLKRLTAYCAVHGTEALTAYLPLQAGIMEELLSQAAFRGYCFGPAAAEAGVLLIPHSSRTLALEHHLAQLQLIDAGLDNLQRASKRLEAAMAERQEEYLRSALSDVSAAACQLHACFCTAFGPLDLDFEGTSGPYQDLHVIPLQNGQLLYHASTILESAADSAIGSAATLPLARCVVLLSRIVESEFAWLRWNTPGAALSKTESAETKQLEAALAASEPASSRALAGELDDLVQRCLLEPESGRQASLLAAGLEEIAQRQTERTTFMPDSPACRILRYGNYVGLGHHLLMPSGEVIGEMCRLQSRRMVDAGKHQAQNGLLTPLSAGELHALSCANEARTFMLMSDRELLDYYILCTNPAAFPPIMQEIQNRLEEKNLFCGHILQYAALAITESGAEARAREYGTGAYRLLHQTAINSMRLSIGPERPITAIGIVRAGDIPNKAIKIHKHFGWQEIEGETFHDPEDCLDYKVLTLRVK